MFQWEQILVSSSQLNINVKTVSYEKQSSVRTSLTVLHLKFNKTFWLDPNSSVHTNQGLFPGYLYE